MAAVITRPTSRIVDAAIIARGHTARAYWLAIGRHLPGAITVSVRVWHGVHAEERVTRRQANQRIAWAAENYAGWLDEGSCWLTRELIIELDQLEEVDAYCTAFPQAVRTDQYDDEED